MTASATTDGDVSVIALSTMRVVPTVTVGTRHVDATLVSWMLSLSPDAIGKVFAYGSELARGP